jgi:hypothetical protein
MVAGFDRFKTVMVVFSIHFLFFERNCHEKSNLDSRYHAC